jgi:hypothetical protein
MSHSAVATSSAYPVAMSDYSSAKVGGGIILFLILVCFFWIIGFSFNFSFLRCKGKRSCKDSEGGGSDTSSSSSSSSVNSCEKPGQQADPGRTFVFAIIISLIILLIIWAFMSNRRC